MFIIGKIMGNSFFSFCILQVSCDEYIVIRSSEKIVYKELSFWVLIIKISKMLIEIWKISIDWIYYIFVKVLKIEVIICIKMDYCYVEIEWMVLCGYISFCHQVLMGRTEKQILFAPQFLL